MVHILPEKAKQLHNSKEGFIIKGRAENSVSVFKKYKTLLAPIPFGAGIKGKLLESMLYGTPNVTSTIGAEAMQNNKDWNGFIEDNPDDFATKAVEIYNNESIWKQSQLNGVSIINDCFNKNNFENEFMDKTSKLTFKFRKVIVPNNFMGQILNHHTLKSTMYMSKWIEEKNSNKKIPNSNS